jgi:hypothetical protein
MWDPKETLSETREHNAVPPKEVDGDEENDGEA